jgi:asparagine synthase (glutamine-hydrolysing)
MSIIFGLRQAEGQFVKEPRLICFGAPTARYAPHGTFVRATGSVGMGFQPYNTHQRSNLETQPAIDPRGNMLTFDGRLDNYADLCHRLGLQKTDMPDSSIVLAAFDRWGEGCFSHFIGDWAIALWSQSERSLYLARDHAGTRTLYYELADGILLWSTYLETFFAEGRSRPLDEVYTASYLACQPFRDFTPYKGIRAVQPAHYLRLRGDTITRKAHWHWMASREIRYRTDAEYEEHLFSSLSQSIQRRTVPGSPIVAQLSGGMDSTSIVCLSDDYRRKRGAEPEDLLDTLSYYDDTEPDWNERPYFSLTEARRGKAGIHVEASLTDRSFAPADASLGDTFYPGADSSTADRIRRSEEPLKRGGYTTILSGIGGDEVLGGVPTPLPELADYLMSWNLSGLLKQMTAWCLDKRVPLISMLFETARFTGDMYRRAKTEKKSTPQWISRSLLQGHLDFRHEEPGSKRLFALRPSSISNGHTWWSIMETLPHLYPTSFSRREYRYPYLDRDLVDYLFAVPCEQLVRPGRRRSLMRRTLKTIVPAEILERRRKAFISRGPLASIRENETVIRELFRHSLLIDRGFINPKALHLAFQSTFSGADPTLWPGLMHAISLELWLRAGQNHIESIQPLTSTHRFKLPRLGANKLRVGQTAHQ